MATQSQTMSKPATTQPSFLQQIGRYQWIVLIACYMGGLFDGLDSSLFTVSLKPAVSELLGTQNITQISEKGAIISALFLLGWTSGGMLFGMLGDRIGRVKALSISILIYALFTGLCGMAQSWEQLALFRFMTAFGIGGELIVGTTLLAESWPEKYRTRAVGVLTTAYQAGYCLVGVTSLTMGMIAGASNWRFLFFIGALPALIVMFIRRRVEEPDRWREIDNRRKTEKQPSKELSSNFFHLFEKEHLKNTLVASAFTGAMLVAYWASTFWIPTWIHQLLPDKDPSFEKGLMMLLIGSFAIAGSTWAGFLAEQIGRRWTVALSNLGYLITSVGMFSLNHSFTPALYAWGAAMGVFIGLTISICYIFIPELYPTRLRATGTGFCFNMGRIAAAIGAIYSSKLVGVFHGSYAQAALTISFILIIAVLAPMFVHETKGKALPS